MSTLSPLLAAVSPVSASLVSQALNPQPVSSETPAERSRRLKRERDRRYKQNKKLRAIANSGQPVTA